MDKYTLGVIRKQYALSRQRLFLLDYDGTLVRFYTNPDDAVLTPAKWKILLALSSDPCNTVVIISGRVHNSLDSWFADKPINLLAEYGHFIREVGRPWKRLAVKQTPGWKPAARSVLATATTNAPGSYIEEKTFSLAWDYDQVEPNVAARVIPRLKVNLESVAEKFNLTVMAGHNVIEITVLGMDKGMAATQWFARARWDFVFAAGDDSFDESLFRALPRTAFTVKIGAGQTAARHQLDNPSSLFKLLRQLVDL